MSIQGTDFTILVIFEQYLIAEFSVLVSNNWPGRQKLSKNADNDNCCLNGSSSRLRQGPEGTALDASFDIEFYYFCR